MKYNLRTVYRGKMQEITKIQEVNHYEYCN